MSTVRRPLGGARRREAVPFTFVAEADAFRSNVAPPPRQRPSASQVLGRVMIGLTLVGGLVGSLLFGIPALESPADPGHSQTSEASQGR
ncbi:hypothetical protein [Streptomyces sp. NPDC005805]|uniref:hypothetical protein n=1 Tax=Streptomyces sp. NPDC005805 TaxID=3157068 RepID=UPI0003771E31